MTRPILALMWVSYVVLGVGYALEGRWWLLAAILLAAVGMLALWRRPATGGPEAVVSDDLARRVHDLLRAGRRTEAVRLVRQETGARLLAASRAVDAVGRGDAAGQDLARP